MEEDAINNNISNSANSSTESVLRNRRIRCESSSRAEDIVLKAQKLRNAQPDKPVHKPRDSLLSLTSEFQNFEGIINWGVLILFTGGIRLTLENLNKYGIRVDPRFWLNSVLENYSTNKEREYPFIYLMLYLQCFVAAVYAVEKHMSKGNLKRKHGYTIHFSNMFLSIFIPYIIIKWKYSFIGPVKGIILTMSFSITFLKMWSYIHVNYWCYLENSQTNHTTSTRRKRKTSLSSSSSVIEEEKDSGLKTKIVEYPNNLSITDIIYFWYAPTLCYELNFPRMERIRKMYVIRRFLEVVVGMNVGFALIQQWMIPSVVNSLIPFTKMQLGNALERVLKLAIPNHLIWLILFYIIFHSVFNTLGEILGFADRQFYRDWWNAKNIRSFWTKWNIPVHKWCVRHMFKPIVESTKSPVLGQLTVFFFSAFFHEYLISVPLGIVKPYAFMAMMTQIPLVGISNLIERKIGPRCGNMCVWLSLILGHPMAILMYYHDFVIEHYGVELIETFGRMS